MPASRSGSTRGIRLRYSNGLRSYAFSVMESYYRIIGFSTVVTLLHEYHSKYYVTCLLVEPP